VFWNINVGDGIFESESTAKGRWILSTTSVHGSARTARLAAMKRVRSYYRSAVLVRRRHGSGQQRNGGDDTYNKADKKAIDRLCQQMDETLVKIQAIDY